MIRPSGKNVLEFEGRQQVLYAEGRQGRARHNNFSAAVQRGEKVVLIGRNGQGKTTLLKALLANGPAVEEKGRLDRPRAP